MRVDHLLLHQQRPERTSHETNQYAGHQGTQKGHFLVLHKKEVYPNSQHEQNETVERRDEMRPYNKHHAHYKRKEERCVLFLREVVDTQQQNWQEYKTQTRTHPTTPVVVHLHVWCGQVQKTGKGGKHGVITDFFGGEVHRSAAEEDGQEAKDSHRHECGVDTHQRHHVRNEGGNKMSQWRIKEVRTVSIVMENQWRDSKPSQRVVLKSKLDLQCEDIAKMEEQVIALWYQFQTEMRAVDKGYNG